MYRVRKAVGNFRKVSNMPRENGYVNRKFTENVSSLISRQPKETGISRTITLTDAVIQVSHVVTCLSQLTFADNVKKLAGSCFCSQLRQLRTVNRSLTTDAAQA